MTRRLGRATVFFTVLLCIAAPVPAFAQHTEDGACKSTLTTLGWVAVVVWVVSAALVLVSVIVDLARARPWSLVALPVCVLASAIGLVLLFAESPLCFSLRGGERGQHVVAVALELGRADAGDLRQLAE
jgi:DMSO reductase anchor subunit